MRSGALLAIGLFVGSVTACAGPRIVPLAALQAAPPPLPRGPVLQPCVLVHQRYTADRSTALEGGGVGKARMLFASFLVHHPQFGTVVIDPAVGREKAKDFGANPWLLRRELGDGSQARALGDLLTAAGIPPESVNYALITHFHFDHVGGTTDIPGAKILVHEPDVAFAGAAHVLGMKMTPQFEIDRIRDRLQSYALTGPAYDGFDSSYDLFGDGSVVAVPTPGHTPGSVSWFVNSSDGARWLFVGDAAWLDDGITRPAQKGWMGRFLDADAEQAGKTLARLHAYQQARPVTTPPDGRGVHIITGHDAAMLAVLPPCGPG